MASLSIRSSALPSLPGENFSGPVIMATHTEEQLDKVLNAFEKVGKELGLIYTGSDGMTTQDI